MRKDPARGQRSLPLKTESPVRLTAEAQHELSRTLAELLLAAARSEVAKRGQQRRGNHEHQDHQ
jgi:hypothetical protein